LFAPKLIGKAAGLKTFVCIDYATPFHPRHLLGNEHTLSAVDKFMVGLHA